MTARNVTEAPHETLLLRICAAPDADHEMAFRGLDEEGWSDLAALAEDKRASPLVRRSIAIAGIQPIVPASALQEIDRACQWHALYGLRQAVALKRLIGVLAQGGFHPIVLKGLGLAHRDYPDQALRPLRDVDLLLTPDEAPAAQDLLLRTEGYRLAPWAGTYGVEYGHQMPELQDVEFELTIEVHHRINARGWAQEPLLLELIRGEATELTLLGAQVRVPSSRANFLHLVEHATLHHAFENGPLVLADLHFLVQRNELDWGWIEAEAARLGLANSLRLLATVAAELGAGWPPAHLANKECVPDLHLASAHVAMLQDKEASERNKMMRRLEAETSGDSGWRAAVARAFRPNPHQLAAFAGSRHDDWRRWLGYPAWLFNRARRYLVASRDEVVRSGAEREAEMVNWLRLG